MSLYLKKLHGLGDVDIKVGGAFAPQALPGAGAGADDMYKIQGQVSLQVCCRCSS